ncbi:MAG: CAP domain-containing protein [Roseiflexaceae bacterium]
MSTRPSQDDINRQQERLAAERTRLADLLLQQSKHGSAWAPPAILGGIREARTAIAYSKAVLRAAGMVIDDLSDDFASPDTPAIAMSSPPASNQQANGNQNVQVSGQGHIVNVSLAATASRQPPDTATLVAWLDRILAQHIANQISADAALLPDPQELYKDIGHTRAVLIGQAPDMNVIGSVRRILATGLMRWRMPDDMPNDLRTIVIQEVVTSTLWPLVITTKLPKGWEQALSTITSPAITRLIGTLRQASKRTPADQVSQMLATQLLNRTYAPGIGSLLEDLCDEERGGAAIVSLAIVRDGVPPPQTKNVPDWLKWVIGGTVGTNAVQGILGNRADALFMQGWDTLKALLWPSQTSAHAMQQLQNIGALSELPPIQQSQSAGAVTVWSRMLALFHQFSLFERIPAMLVIYQNSSLTQKVAGLGVGALLMLLGAGGARQLIIGSQPAPVAAALFTATATEIPTTTFTPKPTNAPTATPVPPTATPVPPTATRVPPTPTPLVVLLPVPPSDYPQQEQEMIDGINQDRANISCTIVLRQSGQLTIAARDHSRDMAAQQQMTSAGSDGSDRNQRAAAAGYPNAAGTRVRENIAAGAFPLFQANTYLDLWRAEANTPYTHKYQMLDCTYNDIGVGVATSNGTAYWTVLFGIGRR